MNPEKELLKRHGIIYPDDDTDDVTLTPTGKLINNDNSNSHGESSFQSRFSKKSFPPKKRLRLNLISVRVTFCMFRVGLSHLTRSRFVCSHLNFHKYVMQRNAKKKRYFIMNYQKNHLRNLCVKKVVLFT